MFRDGEGSRGIKLCLIRQEDEIRAETIYEYVFVRKIADNFIRTAMCALNYLKQLIV